MKNVDLFPNPTQLPNSTQSYEGGIVARGIDFTATGSSVIQLPKGKRFILTSAFVVSALIASLSGGATLNLAEIDATVPTKASLTTAMTGANNDIKLTAVAGGTGGNAITLALVDPSANSQTLAIVVTGNAIVANLATDGGGAIITTASQLLTALAASAPATALATGALAPSNNGSGAVTALTATHLTGGLAYTVVQSGFVSSAALSNTDATGKVQSLTIAGGALTGGNQIQINVTAGSTATTDSKDFVAKFVAI